MQTWYHKTTSQFCGRIQECLPVERVRKALHQLCILSACAYRTHPFSQCQPDKTRTYNTKRTTGKVATEPRNIAMTDFSQRFLHKFIITDSGIMNHDITAHMISTIVTGQVISPGMLLLSLYKHKQMIARYAAMNDTTCTTAGIQQLVQYVVTTRLMQDTFTPSPPCQGVRPLPLCP